MKKTILIIACACMVFSCNSIPRSVKKAFTYHYTDTYTGIDTIINIDGYYANNKIMFYDNGLVVGPFEYGYITEKFNYNESLFLKEIAEKPDIKDSKSFYNTVDCGSYIICGDTIKVQIMHKSWSINDYWRGHENWYKILNKDTLQVINYFPITANKKELEHFIKYYSIPIPVGGRAKIKFVPVPSKPASDYYWILKEKWFWRNETDWKAYMEKVKQIKKK
jgi:hypothetical protein